MTAPISSYDVFTHVREQVETATGRDCYLVEVPRFTTDELTERSPFSILYPIGLLLRQDDAPLDDGPNPFTCNLQVTTVGRAPKDAQWLISKVAEALESLSAPSGASAVDVRLNLGFREGPGEGVQNSIGRWLLRVAR
jgi:hypothetical protein